MLYVSVFRFMSKIMLYYFFGLPHTYVLTKQKDGGRNEMDKLTALDKMRETVVNGLAALVIFAGIPYFLFILCQFLFW
jgi:hypothetical protein